MCSPDVTQGPERRKDRRGWGGWWFLLSVILLHLGVYLTNRTLSGQSLSYFHDMLQRLLPAFGLMFLLLWLFNLFGRPRHLIRRLTRQHAAKAWLLSIAGGVLSMGPMVLWYPLLKELRGQGMHGSLLAAFLYSRAIKIPMLPVMMHYFGALYTGLFVVNILLFSILNGALMAYIDEENHPEGGKSQFPAPSS
jgi:uncharacterized membrane protein YraQ (UPF0718 family)